MYTRGFPTAQIISIETGMHIQLTGLLGVRRFYCSRYLHGLWNSCTSPACMSCLNAGVSNTLHHDTIVLRITTMVVTIT